MEELKQLSQEKETIEAEILMLAEELTSPGLDGSPAPELKGPLIDKDGFPRADIDVYNTRIKRHRYNVLQTDHKMLMKRIEELLPQYVHSTTFSQVFTIVQLEFMLQNERKKIRRQAQLLPLLLPQQQQLQR